MQKEKKNKIHTAEKKRRTSGRKREKTNIHRKDRAQREREGRR